MRKNRIISFVLVFALVFVLAACDTHTHEYSELIEEVPATCTAAGVKAHYTCSGCDKIFDENKQVIKDLEIAALGHDPQHHDEVAPSMGQVGTKEHYECSRCGMLFEKDGEEFVEVTAESLVISELEGVFHEAQPATLTEAGIAAHWVVEGETNRYFVFEDGKYKEVTAEEIVVARKTPSGNVALAEGTPTSFALGGLTAEKVMEAVAFEVEATDGSKYVLNANAIEDFNLTPGKNRAFNFKLTIGEEVVFEKNVSLELYQSVWEICAPGTVFADGEQILFVNINGRAMANTLSYVGYAAGSSGSTKIVMDGLMENNLYQYAIIDEAEDVAILTLQASKSVDGTFYVIRPDGKGLCGGMGYTQWYEITNNNSLAQSFELTVRDNYSVIVHGQQYNYSYLRVWNRYGADLDAFFITNSATYGDDYYIYRLTKKYEGCAHEYSELIEGFAATCEEAGSVSHYECSQCGGYFDSEKNPIATYVINPLGHDYIEHKGYAATPEQAGMKDYYSCSRCSDVFFLVDGAYVKTTAEELVIPQLQADFVPQVEATFEATGIKAHYVLEFEGAKTYMEKVDGEFVVVNYEDLILPKKEYEAGEITVNAASQLEFSFVNLTEKAVLDAISFDVISKDGSTVTVKATAIEAFNDEAIGQELAYTFVYEVEGAEIFRKEVTIAVYEPIYRLISDASELHDGDYILFGNINVRVMSNVVSYAGYAKGSQGSTPVMGKEFNSDTGLNTILIPGDNAEVMPILVKASAEKEGAFYLIRETDGLLLSGGMGYTQWVVYSGDLAQSFSISISDALVATIHGNRFNYSYLRIWNRYGAGLDAFFITNSATYGDNIYIYKLEKSFVAHTEHTDLIHVEAQAAGCDHTGIAEHYHCPRNGHDYDMEMNRLSTVIVDMIPHTYSELHEAAAATCEAAGNVAYYTCTVCHKYFDEEYKEIATPVIDAFGHTYSELHAAKAATCTESGNVAYYECTVCHKLFDENQQAIETAVVGAKGHTYSSLIEGVAATCTELGSRDHYECTECHRLFDTDYNHITNAYIDMHTYENGLCTLCGHVQPVSVAEAKTHANTGEIVTVRGVVVGCTGNYDGGYVWVLIKDLLTNEICGIRKQTTSDGYNQEALVASGSSYAPTMYFELGDLIEIPVRVKNNTAVKGGEAGKYMFLYSGESMTAENNKELVAQYKVGTVEEYRLNLDEYVTVINSQETLEAFCLSDKPQWQLVKLVGTEEHPLKMTTRSATTAGVGDISREYIYLFYDDPKSLDDMKVNGACPVLANFGNQYNLYSMLSSILFGQSQYEGFNFEQYYYFTGEIYCMIIGGSTAYYHFAVLNQGDIHNVGYTDPIPLSAKSCTKAFFKYQEENAAKLGIEVAKSITSAVGLTGVVCCEDMVRFGVAAVQNPILSNIWNQTEYTTSYTRADGRNVNITVNHAVMALDQCKKWISPNYTIIGAKSGWLNYTSESRPYYVCNCLVAVEGPDNTVLVGYVYNKRGDNGDDSVYYYLNILYQILLAKRAGEPTAELEAQLACDSCAGVLIPNDGSVADGADFFSDASQYVHFTMNARELITTASTWKTFTGLTCCRYFTEEQLNRKVVVVADDLNSIDSTPNLQAGDIITIRDALHFMMLPSSNVCPTIIARVIGEELIRAQMEAEL